MHEPDQTFQWLIRHKHLCNGGVGKLGGGAGTGFNGSFAINISATYRSGLIVNAAIPFQWLIRHKHLCNVTSRSAHSTIGPFQWLIRHKHLCNGDPPMDSDRPFSRFNGSFAINISATGWARCKVP